MRRPMLIILAAALFGNGCVQRKFLVETNQPGAQVFVNGKAYGAGPIDVPFTYYGYYDFTVVKDGFETIRERRRIAPPWYAYPPFDFFAENVVPFQIRDNQSVTFELTPLGTPTADQLLLEGEALRARGRQLPDAEVPSLRARPTQPPPPQVVPGQQPARPRPPTSVAPADGPLLPAIPLPERRSPAVELLPPDRVPPGAPAELPPARPAGPVG